MLFVFSMVRFDFVWFDVVVFECGFICLYWFALCVCSSCLGLFGCVCFDCVVFCLLVELGFINVACCYHCVCFDCSVVFVLFALFVGLLVPLFLCMFVCLFVCLSVRLFMFLICVYLSLCVRCFVCICCWFVILLSCFVVRVVLMRVGLCCLCLGVFLFSFFCVIMRVVRVLSCSVLLEFVLGLLYGVCLDGCLVVCSFGCFLLVYRFVGLFDRWSVWLFACLRGCMVCLVCVCRRVFVVCVSVSVCVPACNCVCK